MPRIRKKTSKRGSTNQREKIKRKVTESHKKAKKGAKKDIQWKSKHTKDPGIPNNFPYKDQILAEIAEERRKAEEEKQLKKDKKKQAKTEAAAGDAKNGEGFDGITSVGKSAVTASSKGKQRVVDDEDEDDIPILINSDYADLEAVLDKADVIIEVLDARNPLAYHSSHVEELLKEKNGKKLLLVLNKIDMTTRESVQLWASMLRSHHPTCLFRAASSFLPTYDHANSHSSSNTEKKTSPNDGLGVQGLLNELVKEATNRSTDSLTIAIIGVATTGKSSVINSLFKKPVSPVYKLSSNLSGPSTTVRPLEVTLEHEGKSFCFIDTPSILWQPGTGDAEELRVKDVLLRNRGRIDRAKDPIAVVTSLVRRATTEDLMLFYNLPAFTKNDETAFLSSLAKSRNLIKKAGELDLVNAARIVLRDWSTDSFPYYSTPLPSQLPTTSVIETNNVLDAAILEMVPTRKELLKARGLIRLTPSSVEDRHIALKERWDAEEDSGGGGEGEDQDGDIGVPSEVAADKGEPSESGDEDDADVDSIKGASDLDDVPAPSGKRKREPKSALSPPKRKKVAFDVKTGSKAQGRSKTAKQPAKKKGRR